MRGRAPTRGHTPQSSGAPLLCAGRGFGSRWLVHAHAVAAGPQVQSACRVRGARVHAGEWVAPLRLRAHLAARGEHPPDVGEAGPVRATASVFVSLHNGGSAVFFVASGKPAHTGRSPR
jgi:hypothetical protein